jgi:hypothetical protein
VIRSWNVPVELDRFHVDVDDGDLELIHECRGPRGPRFVIKTFDVHHGDVALSDLLLTVMSHRCLAEAEGPHEREGST